MSKTKIMKKFKNVSVMVMLATLALAGLQFYILQKSWKETASIAFGTIFPGHGIEPLGGTMMEAFFGSEASGEEAQAMMDKKIRSYSRGWSYKPSVKVIEKHEALIREKARKYGVPEDVALGVGLIENGGSETAVSPAGAMGIFQLMPGTARSLGLKVNKTVDERKDPEKNIDAGVRYLALNFYRFGDWGLATWAYHAGEGNVSKAVKIYTQANHGVSLAGLKDVTAMRRHLDTNDVTIHALLSDPQVKLFASRLNDDSMGYPYKVLATATIFSLAKN